MAHQTTPHTDLAKLPPEFFGQQHRPRKTAAAAWTALGYLLMGAMMAGTIVFGGLVSEMPGGFLLALVFGLIVGTVLGLGMAKCFIHAKRLRAPSALDLLARDHRPPVVYFRPFSADIDESKPVALTSWFTEEEQLAKMMNDIGPLVAIGLPSESLPQLGAARVYVDEAKWREAALALMGRAALVIMRVGSSPGFWWEFESVARGIKPERLVLLIPRNQVLYDEFRVASRKLIPTVLPVLTGWDVKRRYRGNLKAVIFFDSEWVPSIVDVQTYRLPFLKRSPATPLAPVLKTALKPVYENAGLRWSAPRVDKYMALLLVAGGVFLSGQLLAWMIAGMPGLPGSYSFDSSYSGEPSTYSDPLPVTASPPVTQSPAEIAFERHSNRLQEVPEFRARIEAVSTSDSGEGRERARQATRELGAQLSQAGMKRLDDDRLLAMADLNMKLILQADTAGCAALVRGKLGARLIPLLDMLDPAEIEQFFDLIFEAMVAEVRQSPEARQADGDRAVAVMRTIFETQPEADAERLRNALINGTGDNDEETCWMGRTLQAGFDKLNREDRVQWLLQ